MRNVLLLLLSTSMWAAINPHPRLLINQPGGAGPTIASLQTKATTGCSGAPCPEWTNGSNTGLKNRVDNYISSCLSGGLDNGTSDLEMANYALAYLISGTTNYRDCAIRLMKFDVSQQTPRVVENFTGTGSQTAFTLSNTIYNFCLLSASDATHINCNHWSITNGYDFVTVAGVTQTVGNSTVDTCASFQVCWTPASNVMTFTTAPANGAAIQIRHMQAAYTALPASPTWPNSNQIRSQAWLDALTFDWLRSSIPSTYVPWFVDSYRATADYEMKGLSGLNGGFRRYTNGAGAYNNGILGGGMLFSCQVGYATWGDNPTDSGNSNDQIAECGTTLDGVVTSGTEEQRLDDDVKYAWGSGQAADGISPEGPEYSAQDLAYVNRQMLAGSTATSTDWFSTYLPNLPTNMGNYFIATASPTTSTLNVFNTVYFPAAFSDEQGGSSFYQYGESFRWALLMDQFYLGATTLGDQVRYTLDQKDPTVQYGASSPCGYLCFAEMLWHTTGWTTQDPSTSSGPLDLGMLRTGLMTSKSDWTAGATWIYTLNTYQNIDHNTPSSGAVNFWRNGVFLADQIVGYGLAGTNNPVYGHLQNILSVSGTTTSESTWDGFPSGYYGNYDYPASPTYPSPVNIFKADPTKYAYMSMDSTGAYSNTKNGWSAVTKALRQVIYLKPDYLFIHDNVSYGSASYTRKQWVVRGSPTLGSNTWTTTNGTQKLNSTSIVPASPVLTSTQVSALSPNKRCANKNEQATTGSCDLVTGYTTRWRVSVGTGNNATSDSALEAWEGMASGDTPSNAAALSGLDANHEGGIINAVNPAIAIFSKDGSAQTTVSWNQTFTGTAHVGIANLAPGSYIVAGNCTSGCTGTVAADGFYYFEGTSGAYTLSSGGATCTITTPSPLPSGGITFRPNASYSATMLTTGCTAPHFSVTSGLLPYGVTLDPNTGILSGSFGWCGTCAMLQFGGNTGITSESDLVVDAVNSLKVTSASYSFVSTDVPHYLLISAGSGWTPGYYVIQSVSGGAAFLDRSPAASGTTGGVYGILNDAGVTAQGTYNFTVSVSDANGNASQSYALTLNLALPTFTLSADHKTVTADYQNGTVRTFHRQSFPAETPPITGTTYYTNPVTGSDSNPCSAAQPCASIMQAYSKVMNAGDGVRMAPGSYIAASRMELTKTGTAGDPIVIECAVPYQCNVKLDDAYVLANPGGSDVFKFKGTAAYHVIDGLVIQGSLARIAGPTAQPEGTISWRDSAQHNTVQNSIVYYGAHACFKTFMDTGATLNVIDGNMCFIGGQTAYDNALYMTSDNTTVTRNIITDFVGAADQNYTVPANLTVTRNTIAYNFDRGIIAGGGNGLYQYNLVLKSLGPAAPHNTAGGFHYFGSGSSGNTVTDNIVAYNNGFSTACDAGAGAPGVNTDDYNVNWPQAPNPSSCGGTIFGAHDQNADPQLMNPAAGDFRLTTASAALSAVRCSTCFLEPLCSPPSVTSTSPLPAGTSGSSYSYTFTATSEPPIAWNATGLPGWATLNTATGVLSGVATAGTSAISVTATNECGSAGPSGFTLQVNGPSSAVTVKAGAISASQIH